MFTLNQLSECESSERGREILTQCKETYLEHWKEETKIRLECYSDPVQAQWPQTDNPNRKSQTIMETKRKQNMWSLLDRWGWDGSPIHTAVRCSASSVWTFQMHARDALSPPMWNIQRNKEHLFQQINFQRAKWPIKIKNTPGRRRRGLSANQYISTCHNLTHTHTHTHTQDILYIWLM